MRKWIVVSVRGTAVRFLALRKLLIYEKRFGRMRTVEKDNVR